MKKLISVMLVLCMVMALIPAMAFAASTDPYIDKDEYPSIQDAVNAGNGKIIHLKGEVGGFKVTKGKTITIHLDNWTIKGTVVVENGATLYLESGKVVGEIDNYGTLDLTDITTANDYAINCLYDDAEGTVSSATIHSGTYTGSPAVYVDPGCSVVVKFGFFNGNSTTDAMIESYGSVVLDGGVYNGKLHDHGYPNADPVINGGIFTDVHAIYHTKAPVAGFATATAQPYSEYWIGASSMKERAVSKANVDKGGVVDFLVGDVKLDGMPTTKQGFYYSDSWKSHYDGYGDADLTGAEYPENQSWKIGEAGNEFTACGRGLVNGRSDFNVVASALTKDAIEAIKYTDRHAYDDYRTNLDAVQSVKAQYKGVNANEVFYDIYVDVDLSAVKSFVPQLTNNTVLYGNYNNSHAWVPIKITFTGLNGEDVTGDGVADKTWVTSFATTNIVSGGKVLMVGVDHNALEDNPSFDYVDKNTGIIYRCTVIVNNVKGDSYVPSEPDDPSNATQKPGTAASATGSQTGTGAGDGPARTGDNSTVMLWATLLVASAAGVAICVVDEAKKRSRK